MSRGLEALPIQRSELSGAAAGQLRGLIVAGSLKPGTRLVEREIGDLFGISRTPVREAFFQLQGEGLLCEGSRGGLYVSPLTTGEISEIYQVLAALERAALLNTPMPEPQMLAALARASAQRRAAIGDVGRTIAADLAWHEALTRFSSNACLLRMTRTPRALAERYERAFFKAEPNRQQSIEEHAEIEGLVRDGDLAGAADRVERHWLGNIEAMAAAVAQANDESEGGSDP